MIKATGLFSFYGISVSIHCDDDEVLFRLNQDFGYFSCLNLVGTPSLSISVLRLQDSLKLKNKKKVFSTRMCQVYQSSSGRFCVYPQGTYVTSQDYQSYQCVYTSADEAYQATFYWLLSRVGEELDLKGIHRLHACGWWDQQQLGQCFFGKSGAGKTTQVLKKILYTKEKIYSDELVLTDGQNIYPFPMRLAIRQDVYQKFKPELSNVEIVHRPGGEIKYLYSIPPDRIAPVENRFKIFGVKAIVFVIQFIVGWGVPQMREYMLRPGQVARLYKILHQRIVCAVKLISKF